MNFQQLQERLLVHLREKVRNGEFTERGLALNVGISQPHIHRVLKGAKALSVENLDLMLQYLRQNLLDFWDEDEIHAHLAKLKTARRPMIEVPLYTSNIGPGCNWTGNLDSQDRRAMPCEIVGPCRHVALVRLSHDPAMLSSLQKHNLALLSQHERFSLGTTALFAVSRGRDAVIRRIRRGRECVYLVPDSLHNQPDKWEAVPLAGRASFPRIIGRVIWMGTDRVRKPARSASAYLPNEATSSYAAST